MDKIEPFQKFEHTSSGGNVKRPKGQKKQTDFKQKERQVCHSNSSNTPQPKVTLKNLEEKGSLNTLPEVDKEFYACQEAVIDGVSISQQEESSKAEALQTKDVDMLHEMWKWFQAKKSERN